MSNILITGGTGFLGSQLVKEILSNTDDNVYLLVRGENHSLAVNKVLVLLETVFSPEKLGDNEKRRIEVILGDVTKENLGLSESTVGSLSEKISIIYHCAAITNLVMSQREIDKTNVAGTRNVLNLAVKCSKKNSSIKVNHISTVFVSGTETYCFYEKDLDIGQTFNNSYEQSKFDAEKVVDKYRRLGLNINLFRPSIIMGRYSDGLTVNFKMLYQPLHFFMLGLIKKLPDPRTGKAHLVNLDIAAKAIFKISEMASARSKNYHIVSPQSANLDFILTIASDFFGFSKPEFTKDNVVDVFKGYSNVQKMMIGPFLPYFYCQTSFDMKNTLDVVTQTGFKFPVFDEKNIMKLLLYCDKSGFIKRKKKNVAIW